MTKTRVRLVLDPVADAVDPEVGRWLAALEEARRDTLEVLAAIEPDAVDRDPGDGGDHLGTVLYHIALVELDWVMTDVLGRPDDPAMRVLLPHDDRVVGGRLTPVLGDPLAGHLERMTRVRELVLSELRPMTSEAFHRVRPCLETEVSAAWVVFHLVDHEAEHRVRLSAIRDRFRG